MIDLGLKNILVAKLQNSLSKIQNFQIQEILICA